MFDRFAEVLLNRPIEGSYTWRIPADWPPGNLEGHLVQLPLRGQSERGIIVRTHQQAMATPTMDLERLLFAAAPLVNSEQIELANWMAESYLCAPGQALFKMLPAPWLKAALPVTGDPPPAMRPDHRLNSQQSAAFESIRGHLDLAGSEQGFAQHLLHGITGSGKTEIYIHAIARALQKGHTALYLVPEISLTVQLIDRLQQVFHNRLALMHSGLAKRDRFLNYLRVRTGQASIVVGTRSAVFAPLQRLGIIIVDEEHDTSYKENSTPRYDGRQIAWLRARNFRIPIVFGSATPRIESRYHATSEASVQHSNWHYHRLQHRATGARLAPVRIEQQRNMDIPIGAALLRALENNYRQGQQSLILLNRRGYHPYVVCQTCETIEQCPHCAVSLNLHRNQRLVCHYCGYSRAWTGVCHCERRQPLRSLGSGTQKLEEYLLHLYPDLRLERLDTDVSHKKGYTNDAIHRLINGDLDVLIGTQMIAKGLDAPEITLVGVLQADATLGVPDFRATERCFSLLTQVAGRSGRGSMAGSVIMECQNPSDPILNLAARQDYEHFYEQEIQLRREAVWPPFCRLLRLLYRHPSADQALQDAEDLAHTLQSLVQHLPTERQSQITLLGPVSAPIEKLHQQYRYHLIIKTSQISLARHILRQGLARQTAKTKSILEIDFDPVDML
ncbi:MAG: primosomal protein N' [Leptospiraceae bacterium]|nr:primosomal protein N' [Leptospiraceae bacterium]